ncbi:MAG: transcriptional regulator, NifA subfamily, Fis Family [Myxococcales bacterium]|nr:transcriptional regulator, NifA subfamily, Fis Family [Myxococcales bacterium]
MLQKPNVLLAVGPLLQREVDLDELLDQLVHKIAEALSADRGTLYLVDPEAGELFSKAAHLPELKQIRLKIGQGIAGTVAATGQMLNLPTAEGDLRFFRDIDKRTGYRTRSVLAAPLRDRDDNVIGVVQVLNAKRGSFSATDEEYIKRLAAEAALVVENTSLYALVRPRRNDRGSPPLPVRYRYNRIVGESAAMQRVYDLTRKAAATDASVLLRGESGTGKELIARAIHYNSTRRDGPFVKVDCTTIPPTLMENELFGHERGAYTGAEARARGKCEAANGGTLFIDEIGELPLPLQSKLLRLLQDREFERVGGTRTLAVDVRVVTATHRDLEGMVGRGQFREDLYYRVKVVQLTLPPLRDRGAEDIVRLAEHFLDLYGRKHGKPLIRFGAAARARLVDHRWPGNIRELEHCVESAVVLCEGAEIAVEQLALAAGAAAGPAAAGPAATDEPFRPRALADVERQHILRTLAAADGNRSRAAELLGIGRNTLLRKLKEYGKA